MRDGKDGRWAGVASHCDLAETGFHELQAGDSGLALIAIVSSAVAAVLSTLALVRVFRDLGMPIAPPAALVLYAVILIAIMKYVVPIRAPYAIPSSRRFGPGRVLLVVAMLAIAAGLVGIGLWILAVPLVIPSLASAYIWFVYDRVRKIAVAIDADLDDGETVLGSECCRWRSNHGSGVVVLALTGGRLICGDQPDGAPRLRQDAIGSIQEVTFARDRRRTGRLDIRTEDTTLQFHNVSPLNLLQLILEFESLGVPVSGTDSVESVRHELNRWRALAPYSVTFPSRRGLRRRWFPVAAMTTLVLAALIGLANRSLIEAIVGESLDGITMLAGLAAVCFAIGTATKTIDSLALVPFVWLGWAPLFILVEFKHPAQLFAWLTFISAGFLFLGAQSSAVAERNRQVASL